MILFPAMHTEVLKRARELHQNLAKEECHICKRLFGDHSLEEFKSHALDDVTIELDIQQCDPERFKKP